MIPFSEKGGPFPLTKEIRLNYKVAMGHKKMLVASELSS